VAVPVSVTNLNGDPVRNLRAEDFRLDEEGQPQQVQSLGAPGKTPIELALLFDVSGSVRERFEFEKSAAVRFLREVLKPTDTVTVFSIGFDPKVISERSNSLDKVTDSLKHLEPTKEGTAFFDTVVKAAQYLNDHAAAGTRRVIVVISDGEDNHSDDNHLSDVQRELQRSDTLFYAINPSGPSIRLNKISMRGHNGMTTLANDTGGVAFLPEQDADLERVFKQIAAELQAQYLLGYYSSNETNDGKFRRIKIQLPGQPSLRIRARQGYYAPRD
jgi:Ca-activated chloride channel family protein